MIPTLLLTLACDLGFEGDDPRPHPGDAAVLGIGDSFFAWNAEEGAGIPDVVGAELGMETFNVSVSGATVLGDEDEGDWAIPNQYVSDAWTWVIMGGGGNDIEGICDCSGCDDTLDALLSADGGGAIPALVDEALDDGAQVAWVGYPELPESREGFVGCDDEQALLIERLEQMAADREGVIFVDGRDAFSPDALEYYDEDHVHPSVEGSRALGELVAQRILEMR